jgi:arabinogalactan oligomer/maltooligosaccharide transport system permease protein
MLVFSAFPLVYVLSASLNPGGTLLTANSLFARFDIGSYIALFQDPLRPYGAGS